MARQKKQTVFRNVDLLANQTFRLAPTAQGVAATVTFFVEVGTFHASDTIKVQIWHGSGASPTDFNTARTLSTATTSVQLSAEDMGGVDTIALVRNGTNTSVDPTRGTFIITQDIDI